MFFKKVLGFLGLLVMVVAFVLAFFLIAIIFMSTFAMPSSFGDQNAVKLSLPIQEVDPQLKALYDYTVFHIGIYITLTTGVLAALSYKAKRPGGAGYDWAFIVPILFFAMAGACGGIVGSNISNYVTYSANEVIVEDLTVDPNDATKFIKEQKKEVVVPFLLGNYNLPYADFTVLPPTTLQLTYADWIKWEHHFFWAGAFFLVVVVLLSKKQQPDSKPSQQEIKISALSEDQITEIATNQIQRHVVGGARIKRRKGGA